MEMKIDVGAGRFPASGYKTVDLFGEPDIVATMWEIPLEDGSVDVVRSSHSLEHVYKHKVVPTLTEWYRLLKPGGRLELWVPDLEYCVRKWLEKKNTGYELDCIFGMQSYDGHTTHEGEVHYTGFTKEILIDYVAGVGFTNIKARIIWDHNMDTIELLARKPL